MKRFWMVLGSGRPNVRHESKESAKLEAERLARANRNSQFFVLEAVAVVCASDVIWSTCSDSSGDQMDDPFGDVPF